MKRAGVILLVVMMVLGCSREAAALRISPFKTTLVPGRGDATQVFRVENNSDASVAVQVSVESWSITPAGEEVNADAEDDFAVFPAQVVLGPRESRGVRVQWLGDAAPKQEIPYRVVAEQIPVNLKGSDTASGLKFLLRFKAGLYVSPGAGESDVQVASTSFLPDGAMRVTLVNKGAAHTLLRKPSLVLSMADGREVTLDETQLGQLPGSNMHAGGERYFDIPKPEGVSTAPAQARLSFENSF